MDATTASVPQAVSDGILSVEQGKTTKQPGCDHPLRVYALGNTYCRTCTRWLGRGDLRESESLPGGTVLRHQLAQMEEEGGAGDGVRLAKELYKGRASYDSIKNGTFQTDGFAVIVAHQTVAECEDSEVADYICKLWNAASPALPETKGASDGPCQACGYPCEVWFAPNNIWNAVVPGRSGLLCLRCFIATAQQAGIDKAAWEVRPEAQHGTLEELDAAAQALAEFHLHESTIPEGILGGTRRALWCGVCQREELGGTLTHAEICKVGRVLKAVGAVRQAGNESRWAAHKQTITAEKHAKLDAHACGDCLYDPSIDRSLVCTLNSGHEGMHFDAEDQRNWQGDDVDSIRRCVVAPGGMEYEARGAEDIHGVGYAVPQADGDSGKAESDVIAEAGARVFRDVPKPDAKLQVLLLRPKARAVRGLHGVGWFTYDAATTETLTRSFDTEQAAWDAAWAHLSPATKHDTHLGAVEAEAAR